MRATVDGNKRVLMINLRIYIEQAIVATSSRNNNPNDRDYLSLFPYIVIHMTQKNKEERKEKRNRRTVSYSIETHQWSNTCLFH